MTESLQTPGRVAAPAGAQPDAELARARGELESMGFKIIRSDEGSITALRSKFHWDCIMTKLTYVVFVRRTASVTANLVEEDRTWLVDHAKTLDPSSLPRGFQKGVAVLTAYLSDEVGSGAKLLCDAKPVAKFAFFYVPGVRDLSERTAHFVRSTPAWGAIYYSKFRWILGRILEPESAPNKEPISMGGAVLLVVMLMAFALPLLMAL